MKEHSVRGYLSRRSTDELQAMLQYYLRGNRYKDYREEILMTLQILEERFVPDVTSEQYLRVKEMLLKKG